LIFQLVVGVCGADTEGGGEVEAVVFMRGEVRLDRDAAVFDVSLHDGQYSVHVDRAGFLQVLEGHVKEVVGKHILRSDLESEARSTGEFEQEASHNVCQISALGLGLGGAEVHEEGEDEEEAVSGATTLHDPHSD
jgi:hypothetical protein